jgi:translation initiation factor IF-3
MTYTCAEHDLETKVNIARRLIEDKHNDVRIVLRLRGRETDMMELAKNKVRDFISSCSSFSKIKKPLYNEGRDIIVVLTKLS